ncbi:HAD-IA family hydrolase [Microvirga sp. VF16]|uniref:HAD-IA family hydrolase n=1 Tax=Microvirga sp. VF16 TaxID=2807101 RepID=UPI00353046BB
MRELLLRRYASLSKYPNKFRPALGLTGLWRYFEHHINSTVTVAAGRPAPDLFLDAAAQMVVKPAHCLVVEDSIAGVKADVAARMKVIGFRAGDHWITGHSDRLLAVGTSTIVRSATELTSSLTRQPVLPH